MSIVHNHNNAYVEWQFTWINIHRYHHGKTGVKWDINYNFSEKSTIIAAETVLREDVIGKV
jgi:hypothetical protein